MQYYNNDHKYVELAFALKWMCLKKFRKKRWLQVSSLERALKIHVSEIVNISFDFYISLLFKNLYIIDDFISEF